MAGVPYDLHCNFEGCDICQELMQVEEELYALSQKRLTLKSSRNSTHDILHKIPAEIISHIFMLVDEGDNCPTPRKEGLAVLSEIYLSSPVILSSVCRKWREIALTSPHLWTNIYINMHKEPDWFSTEWFKRAGALPMRVTLYTSERCRANTMNTRHGRQISGSVYDFLRPYLSRLKYLDLEYYAYASDTHCLWTLFHDLTIEQMPRSDSFHLHLGPHHSNWVITLTNRLRPGRLCSRNSNYLDMMMFEWKNLTHLEASHLRIGHFLDIIREAPKLLHCVSLGMDHIQRVAVGPAENKALKYLKLSFAAPEAGSTAFQHMSLPSLHRLEYVTNTKWNGEYRQLQNFIFRTGLDTSQSLQTTLRDSRHHLDHGLFDLTAVTHLIVDHHILEPLLQKMSQDVSAFPVLQELQFEVSPKSVMDQPVPGIQATTTAVLGEFVDEHNRSAHAAATSNDPNLNSKILGKNLTVSRRTAKLGLVRHRSRRSLELISLLMITEVQEPHIQMTKQTLLLLQKAQKIGPLKVEIYSTSSAGGRVDILQDPRYLKDDGFGFVLLQSIPG